MKNLIFLLIFSSTHFISAQTSVYHPFPDSNSVWNFNQYGDCFENYSIVISGDTIVKNYTYHKLYIPFVMSSTSNNCGGILKGYKGAIRHDLANKKVYFISPQDTSEQLLYDFTLQVGDTVRGYTQNFNFMSHVDVVISVDSILVGNSYRKRWNINNCYNISFIEGIGSTYGLFENSPGCVTDFPDYSLTCFKQDSKTIYPDTNTNCQIITSGLNNPKIEKQINVFPNPSNGSIVVDFNSNQIKECTIVNLLGEVIFYKEIKEESKLKVNNLPQGYFFLILVDHKGQTINRKIISSK